MTLSDYERRRTADVDGPVAATLTKLEQKLCTVFKRTLVKGKRGRPVPVIFTKQMEQYIDCLILHRAGLVDDDNLYLFARVTPSLEHIRGTDAMRESANACGAERPDTLRSTTLRKQIATLSQVMNLQENELDVLATFLGHDIRVHRKYYRLADETIQVAKVAKLLMNMEKGGQGLLPGQTLDSLDIEGQEIAATGESPNDAEEDNSSEDESDNVQHGNGDDEEADEEDEEASCTTNDSGLRQKKDEAKQGKESLKAKRRRKHYIKRPWREDEKGVVYKHFQQEILLKKLPGKASLEKCLREEPCLNNRTWRNLKDYIRAQFGKV